MDTSIFRKLFGTAVAISIAACVFLMFSLIIGSGTGTISAGLLVILSVFAAISISKISKSFQDEITALSIRVSDLEKKLEKK